MPISPNTTTLLRALKGAPLACLFALLLCNQPASQIWLTQCTGYSHNSVLAALRLLEELGLARRCAPLGEWYPCGDQSARDSLTAGLAAALSLEKPESAALAPDPSNFDGAPGGGEESISSITKDIPPPPGKEPQNEILPAGQVSVERILEATRELFGEMVHGPPSRYRDRRVLLATIAEVYARRHTLSKPARVAYSRLKNKITPAPDYLEDPCAYLPPSFLAAIGLRGPPEPPPEAQPDPESTPQATGEADETPTHLSLSLPTGRDGTLTIAQAWQKGGELLRTELPGRVYDRRVDGLRLQCFDPQSGEVTLAAADAESAAWLSARLAKRLSRILSGICAREIQVIFIAERAPSQAEITLGQSERTR